jgi:hypothetical protein
MEKLSGINKLLKPLLFFLLIGLLSFPSEAQRWKILRYEASFGIGTCNIFGDIGGSATANNLYGLKDLTFNSTRPSLIFGARYKLMENQSLKLNINFCMGGGSDVGSKHFTEGRDYSFTSYLSEQSLQYEYYFIHEDAIKRSTAVYNHRGMMNNYSRISAYGFAGLGGLFYVPSLKGTSPTPELETRLGTGYTLTIPVGIGAKLVYSDHWSFNAELGYRYTLSDGLDGLTSKYSHSNDIYWIASVSACYRIKTARNGLPDFMARWFPARPPGR